MFIFFDNEIIIFIVFKFMLVIKTYIIFTLKIFNKLFYFIIIYLCIFMILSDVCLLNNCLNFIKMKKDNRRASDLN